MTSYTDEQVRDALRNNSYGEIMSRSLEMADVIDRMIADRTRLQAEVEALRGPITPLEDATLLRNLVEEVEEMHPTVRNQLLQFAVRIERGEQIGVTHCRRCGEKAEVTIHSSRAKKWDV